MTPLIRIILIGLAFLLNCAFTHGATNSFKILNWGADYAAINPATNEVVFSRGRQTIFGFDLSLNKTNWTYRPLGGPDRIAVSSDGSQLFIGLATSNAVLQVESGTRNPVRLTRLLFTNIVYTPVGLFPLPGQPNSVIVLGSRGGGPIGVNRLFVMDAGVIRPRFVENVSLAQLYDGKIYCRIDGRLRIVSITPDGLELNPTVGDQVGFFRATPDYLVSGNGVISSRDTLSVKARLPGIGDSSVPPVAFPDAGRIFFSPTGGTIAYDLQSLCLTAQFSGPSAGGGFWSDAIPISPNSYMLLSASRIALVEPMSISTLPKADLAISAAESIEPVKRGDPVTVTLSITNRGPSSATGVLVTNLLGSGPGTQIVTASQGTILFRGTRIVVNLGEMPVGASAEVSFTLTANPTLYSVDNVATVTAAEPDPDEIDNTARVYTRILEDNSDVSGRDAYLYTSAIAYAPSTKKIWALMDPRQGKGGNALAQVDPQRLIVERTIPLNTAPGNILLLSGDDQFALLKPSLPALLYRVNLSSGVIEQIALPGIVLEVKRVPGTDQTFIVGTTGGTFIYDGLVARPNPLPEIATAAVRPGELFYALNGVVQRAAFDQNGFQIFPGNHTPIPEIYGSLDIVGRRLLASFGMVIDVDTGVLLRPSRGVAGMIVDHENSKAFYTVETGSYLRVEDADQQIELKRVGWPGANSPSAFLMTGQGSAILQNGARLLIGDAPEFGSQPTMDLSLSAETLTPPVVGAELQYQFTIKNNSATAVSNIVLLSTADANLALAGSNIPLGTAIETGNTFTWQIDRLDAGASITGIQTVIPLRAGNIKTRAAVGAMPRDLIPENNRVEIPGYVEIQSAPDQQVQLLVASSAFVYVPSRQKFLASPLPGKAPGALEIDPLTGRVTPTSIPLPPATILQLSGDGQKLIALVETNRTVLLFDLATSNESGRIALDEPGNDLRILPGSAQSFAVSMGSRTVLYDGTAPRPQAGLGYGTFAFSDDGNSIYGFDGYYNMQPVSQLGFEAATLRTGTFPNGGTIAFESQSNLVFTTRGQVLDFAKEKWVTSYEDVVNYFRMVPDLSVGRVYLLSWAGMVMYDAQTHEAIKTNYFSLDFTGNLQLARWGGDGLAVRADQSIIFIRSSSIGVASPADVSIQLQQLNATIAEARYEMTVSNLSSSNSANTRPRFLFPADWQAISTPAGSSVTNGEVSIPPRQLAPSESYKFQIAVKPTAGSYVVRAHVSTDAQEFETANNWSAWVTTIGLQFALDQPEQLPIPGVEMLVTTNRTLAIITGLSAGLGLDCRLLTVDAFTGQLKAISPFLGVAPNKLAVSEDGHYAYVSIATTGIIHRINLWESNRVEQTVELPGPLYAYDMTGVSGDPKAVVATQVTYGTSAPERGAIILRDGAGGGLIPGVTFLSTGPRIVGYGNGGMRELFVTPTSFTASAPLAGVQGWADVESDALRIYTENTLSYTFAGGLSPVSLPWGSIRTEPFAPRVYVMVPEFPGARILAYQNSDLQSIGSAIVGGVEYPYAVDDLVRWGADGFAFRSVWQVHLVRSSLIPITAGDRDNDGLDDAYEASNGLNPNVNDTAADLDNDGASNLSEMIAGTSPNNAASRLELRFEFDQQSGWSLGFQAIAGRRYQLLERDSLTSGDWQILAEQTTEGAIQKPVTIGNGSHYYSIRIIP